MSNTFAYNDGCALRVIVEFDGFYMHWYWSCSIKRATKLKLRDRTLPASLVSYAGTILSLLWPNKCALVFCRHQHEQTKSFLIQNNGKTLVGLYLKPRKGHSHKRVAWPNPLYWHTGISTWWMRYLLWASRPWKGTKIGNSCFSNCSLEQRGVENSTLIAMLRV